MFKRRDKLERVKRLEERQQKDLEKVQRRGQEIQREVELYRIQRREANSP